MDWAKGYSARYYISILDKETLRDVDRVEITGGSINRTLDQLRESADLECMNYRNTTEQYVRVWLDTKQDGNSSHIPLFTGVATSPSRSIKGFYETNSLQCYSLLKIAQDILLPRGWYAPTDANGAKLVRDLLKVIKTGISLSGEDLEWENAPTLQHAIIAEEGENNLSMADRILNAMNWRLTLDGQGNIYIGPYPKEPIITFDSNENDVVESDITVEYDWYNAPNVFRAVMDDSYAVARDDREDSPLSTVNRGREVWVEETGCELNANETIAEYANRMLKEYQQVSTTIKYDRRFFPGVIPTESVRLNYPAQKISGTFLVTSQTITLGYNAKTSEEVIQI